MKLKRPSPSQGSLVALGAARAALGEGRLDEAEALCRSVLITQPNNVDTKLVLSDIARLRGRALVADQLLNSVVASAAQLAGQNRLQEAEALCGEVISRQETHADALLLVAEIAITTGETSGARDTLRKLLAVKPDCVVALVQLANLLRSIRGQEEARELCRRAIEISPGDADAHIVLANCYSDQWYLTEAISELRNAIELRPKFWEAYNRLGHVLRLAGNIEESAAAYRKAIELMPGVPNNYAELASILGQQGDTEGTENALKTAREVSKSSAIKWLELGRTLKELGNSLRAEEAFRRAADLAPESDSPRLLLAQVLQELGHFEDASSMLIEALRLNPSNASAFGEMVYSAKVKSSDGDLIRSMSELVKQPTLTSEVRTKLYYSIGKSFDDLGEYGKAMDYFHEGNRLARTIWRHPHSEKATYSATVDHMIATFTKEFFGQNRRAGSSSEEPVFIVGMPRSGTTLTEQIASGHPSVGAIGEHSYLPSVALRLLAGNSTPSVEAVSELAHGYLRVIHSMTAGEPRITDKTPENYLILGLIHLAFPNARIIHCRRHAIDTCLSIYVTPITVSFSHSLSDIAFAYHEYERLMAHWREVLPADRFFESNYEELVADPEPIARRMIDYLGLPWDEAVLRRERDDRAIKTASRWQVRQNIHTGSVERWRRYEPWIQELLDEFPELAGRRSKS